MKDLRTYDNKASKVVDAAPVISKAASERIKKGIYCPQNRWGVLSFGIDAKVGFAHVKEGAKGQFDGLKKMLAEIVGHKTKDKVNAFACGSPVTTNTATKFRSDIEAAVKAARIGHFNCHYGNQSECLGWLCYLEQSGKEVVIGTAGITSCIGVIAWSPNVLNYSIEYISTSDTGLLKSVTLQEPGDKTLEKVDLNQNKYKVT